MAAGTQENRVTILIADDHPLFRDALKNSLSSLTAGGTLLEAGTYTEIADQLDGGTAPDLVLLDLSMPGVSGLSGLLYLRAQYPDIPVIVISAHEDPTVIRRCMEFGASGYVPKSMDISQIREAVSAVLEGEVWMPPGIAEASSGDDELADLTARFATLTPQQVRVLMMLSEGLLNKQIAYKLSVSEATIKAHVSAILQKLNVESRTQAVIAAARIDPNLTVAPFADEN
ncbi:MAG: response regulator transcription factor [Rhodobiaceae bacterium]|nr:response regulator transcription factor [Rhodobiaceae bacterium]MCC0055062.1 response regulator transcription factor [Rhodobiaceae bacterium]